MSSPKSIARTARRAAVQTHDRLAAEGFLRFGAQERVTPAQRDSMLAELGCLLSQLDNAGLASREALRLNRLYAYLSY